MTTGDQGSAPGPRILVVEDKESMRVLLEKILAERYDVTGAADAVEALTELNRGTFDLVLTDVRMPGPDGFQLVRAIKERWPATEVVMMTAYASIESAVEAMRLGAYDYIQKPFDPDDVSLVVARALERGRSISSGPPPQRVDVRLSQMSYREAVNLARERMSRDYLAALLRDFGGNVSQAADRAGIERESLHRLLKRYGLRAEDFRTIAHAESGMDNGETPSGD